LASTLNNNTVSDARNIIYSSNKQSVHYVNMIIIMLII